MQTRASNRKLRSLRRTAYHEAGHAVQAWWEHMVSDGRIKFKEATIIPGEDYLGRVLSERYLSGLHPDIEITARTQWLLEARIRILIAGDIAERHYDPRGYRSHGGSFDRRAAIDLLSYLEQDFYGSQECFKLHWRLLQAQTRQCIVYRWPLVKAVAKALLRHETLSWNHFVEVVREALDSWKPVPKVRLAARELSLIVPSFPHTSRHTETARHHRPRRHGELGLGARD